MGLRADMEAAIRTVAAWLLSLEKGGPWPDDRMKLLRMIDHLDGQDSDAAPAKHEVVDVRLRRGKEVFYQHEPWARRGPIMKPEASEILTYAKFSLQLAEATMRGVTPSAAVVVACAVLRGNIPYAVAVLKLGGQFP